MRTHQVFQQSLTDAFKNRLLAWASQYREVVWLDANDYPQAYQQYDALLAVDAFTSLKTDYQQAFKQLSEYQQTTKDWLFGYLTYDLKNDVEKLQSTNKDALHFADLFFFQPKRLFLFKGNQVEVSYLNMIDDELETDWEAIQHQEPSTSDERKHSCFIQAQLTKSAYLEKIEAVLQHIQRGDIYEANFCQTFTAENAEIHPLTTYQELNQLSRPPFAAFAKFDDHYVLSASPERYIQKKGTTIISQPIKGTARRLTDTQADINLREQLQNDPKERAENVMIVDLVRNDLSRTATRGSVRVEELCGLYTFQQVHQLISTITSEVPEDLPPVEVLRTTFPMGSMTGAPKISAMQIMEKLETHKRGVYSGSLGYFTPDGDFDFNVIIRTILYNADNKQLSFSVGGAITHQSIPEKEYEECLVKADALLKVLTSAKA